MAWYHRIRNVLRPERARHDLEREMSFHLAERSDDLVASGLDRSEARRQARSKFGNYTLQLEDTREMDIAGWLDETLRSIRLAVRSLARTPAFTITVVVTLAIGIGANSAVFSAIDAVLLRPLRFPDSGKLLKVHQYSFKVKDPETKVAPIRLEDWNRMNSSFQGLTGYYTEDSSETSGALPERVKQAFVAPRFLQVLGVPPALGRDFEVGELRFGGPSAVLVSDRFWRRRLSADPNAVGRKLRLGRSAPTIVGIMPPWFLFPDRDVDVWSPVAVDAPYAQSRESTWYTVIGRLNSGSTASEGRANLEKVQSDLGKQFGKTDAELSVGVQPLKEVTIGGVKRSLWLLFGSVSLLLLIACINIAALLLARGTQRRQEIAIRFSLGASRARVVGQLLTEVLVLALAGSALGLIIVAGAARVFRALAANLPRVEEIRLDWRIVLYSLACALAATLLCGLLPSLRGTTGRSGSLVEGGRGQVSGRHPLHWLLVGIQVALAVTLLTGAGLLVRSLQQLGRVAPGFETRRILTLRISASWGETADFKGLTQRIDRTLETLRAVPGVGETAVSAELPGVHFPYQTEVDLQGVPVQPDAKITVENRFVSEGYFRTLGIPLLAGEFCRPGPGCVAVNRSFVSTYLNGAMSLGYHLQRRQSTFMPLSQVRGIVGDAREQGLNRTPAPTVYWITSAAVPDPYYLIRTQGDPLTMAETIRRKIHEIEPRRSVFDIMPLDQRLDDTMAENRLRTILLASFAVTAVLLACVGLYGMLSYLVSVRRREVGLRLALGALRSQIVKQFLLQGMLVSSLGCVAGLIIAVFFTRLLSTMLFGVTASDATTFSLVAAIVLGVAALASLLPSIRAARVEPMRVLRDE